MNIVFLIGKIITDIEFKFMINSKNISVVKFMIKTLNNQIINIKAYNEQADYIYSKLKKDDNVIICGYLQTDGNIIINKIKEINNYTKIFRPFDKFNKNKYNNNVNKN